MSSQDLQLFHYLAALYHLRGIDLMRCTCSLGSGDTVTRPCCIVIVDSQEWPTRRADSLCGIFAS